jgi:hypothetical protein
MLGFSKLMLGVFSPYTSHDSTYQEQNHFISQRLSSEAGLFRRLDLIVSPMRRRGRPMSPHPYLVVQMAQ